MLATVDIVRWQRLPSEKRHSVAGGVHSAGCHPTVWTVPVGVLPAGCGDGDGVAMYGATAEQSAVW
jgi:hypothetical protein